ncbi:exosporium glycoprotein BclB-related protein [Sporosarcina sp. BP05]|uniref:exosporium glycoprotein BclB-related protein n=1 Tax=Sporosarcina sp. BP05 TaxID=2758726 RepID=UPI00164674EC|nr:exosporium glycoprotein BclB-related protein [Sporosarcina sp. BP05]
MISNNFKMHGCSGCGGSHRNSSGCFRVDTGQLNCNVGPFTAVAAGCIPPANANTGSIIPFASGVVPVTLTSILGGLVSTPAFVGFGTNILSPTVLGSTIDLSGLFNEAFSVPRAGTLTAISASFTATVTWTLLGTTTITAQIYRAPAGSNTFSPTGVSVNLAPSITVALPVGTTVFGDSSNFSPVPVAVGDRLLMVFSSTTSGIDIAGLAIGTASAGITIS